MVDCAGRNNSARDPGQLDIVPLFLLLSVHAKCTSLEVNINAIMWIICCCFMLHLRRMLCWCTLGAHYFGRRETLSADTQLKSVRCHHHFEDHYRSGGEVIGERELRRRRIHSERGLRSRPDVWPAVCRPLTNLWPRFATISPMSTVRDHFDAHRTL